ncbi:MAG: hypothetical protein KKC20_03910 [Proteobacteria bacterium]|nr:hypothetical protein [Pseudomonadota bacterium]
MIQRLSSVSLTFYSLVILVLLMGTGVFLNLSHSHAFTRMNEIPILTWITTTWPTAPALVIWFFLLCLVATILFVNALCCSLDRQLSLARRSARTKNWLFFILHCLFILVLICHGLILVTGEKQGKIGLAPGQSHWFGPYEILVSEVVFMDDKNILTVPKNEQRQLMTRKNIHIHENYAFLTLLKNKEILASKKVRMLSPLRYRSVQITLIEFVVLEPDNPAGSDDHPSDKALGVIITLTHDFLSRFFFLVYGVMILALAGFTAMTWKRPDTKKGEIV